MPVPSADIPLQTLVSLQQCGRDLSLPFRLALPDGSELVCEQLLRILPGKRLVMRATQHGNTVLAKLFFATRNWQQERDGYALLQATGANTPALLAQHALDAGGVCLYAFVEHALSLDTLWQQAHDSQKAALLDRLLPLLQQCYAQRLLQQDLHLGNFLLQGSTLTVLDPASCRRFGQAADQQDNLALLLAQLPFADWPLALQKIAAVFPATNSQALAQQAQQLWRQRSRDYLQKIRRDCSDVADLGSDGLRILCRRAALSDTLVARLRDPQTLMAGATVLKNGNSAKVFLIEIDGRLLVVKQYINKDWLRTLRRAFRPSRAARSWHYAHALAFAGITVPAPVALVEQTVGPLVRSAWYISEFRRGRDLLASWQERAPADGELEAIHALFLLLQHCGISHGDMKATNLITDGEQIALIDYDGASQHHRQKKLARALAADKQRFLQNWPDNPALQQRLAELITP